MTRSNLVQLYLDELWLMLHNWRSSHFNTTHVLKTDIILWNARPGQVEVSHRIRWYLHTVLRKGVQISEKQYGWQFKICIPLCTIHIGFCGEPNLKWTKGVLGSYFRSWDGFRWRPPFPGTWQYNKTWPNLSYPNTSRLITDISLTKPNPTRPKPIHPQKYLDFSFLL